MKTLKVMWELIKIWLFADKKPVIGLPATLDEAIEKFEAFVPQMTYDQAFQWREEKWRAETYHTIGRGIRNDWGLWDENSKLRRWFKVRGIWHAHDMSGIILTTYWRKLHNKLPRFDEQVRHYVEYWARQEDNSNGK